MLQTELDNRLQGISIELWKEAVGYEEEGAKEVFWGGEGSGFEASPGGPGGGVGPV